MGDRKSQLTVMIKCDDRSRKESISAESTQVLSLRGLGGMSRHFPQEVTYAGF